MTDTEDHRAEVLRELNPETRLQNAAHYYAVALTGTPAIDVIVSAINWAGKRAHHTEDWYAFGLVDRIDTATEVAAEQYRHLEAALARVAALHTPAERPGMCPTCFVTAPCPTVRAIDEVGGME